MTSSRTRLIEMLVGLLSTQLIVFGLAYYIINEPARITSAQEQVLATQLEDSMTLYAENCTVCHGLNGEGIGTTPALNTPGLQSMPFDEIFKTISRGRFNTAMPAWSKDDGGPLSDYQIDELVALIRSGDWNETGDRVVNLGLAPLIPFTTEPDPALLELVGGLPDGATLQTGISLFASQCVACHGADGAGTAIAPALNGPLVREKTADELTHTITFGSAGTLMAGWSNVLSTEEINAAVTLIQRWNEIPTGAIPAPDITIHTTAESIALGSQLFATNCSRCHGPDGQGTPRAPALNVKSFLTNTADLAIKQIITAGVPGTAMPAWGDRMTEAEIQAIVGFIRQWEPTAPEIAQPTMPGGGSPPWLRNNTATGTSTNTAAATAIPTALLQLTAQPTQALAVTGATPQAQVIATSVALATGHTEPAGGTGGPPWAQTTQPVGWYETVDWRILIGVTAILSVAFTLISMGVTALKKK